MTPHLPTAEVFAVQQQNTGQTQCLGRVTVRCPFCGQLHSHRVFTNDTIDFSRTAPCSTDHDIRRYGVNLTASLPKRAVSQEHVVAGEDLDDSAIDIPVPNRTE